jgi:hypothetical protein
MRTRMNKPALLLSLLALGALGLVACGGGDDDQTTAAFKTKVSVDHAHPTAAQIKEAERQIAGAWQRELAADNTADNKPCGYFDRYRFAVVEGDVSCSVASGVMRRNLSGGARALPGSWHCGGSDSGGGCVNEAGDTILDWVTCHNRSPCPGWIKHSVAQRRVATAHPDTPEAKLSREQTQELKREANTWASLFADRACNRYMGQPICQRLACEREVVSANVRVHGGGRIENCTPLSAAFQKSFADATVEDIKRIVLIDYWKGRPLYEAAVKFSNGEVVVFVDVPPGGCPGGPCSWGIADLPRNSHFLAAAAPRE